ncbi:MAG: hypothetical protein N3A61_00310, partial [Ignavibacteria bacterium]|nr:hypothetical protein [Ignavibacteria bacterium]
MKIFKLLLILSLVVFLFSCGEKLDLTEFSTGKVIQNPSDTTFVQLNPNWTGFNNPSDILVGREPFIYIADTDNDRIVMMNLAGVTLGTLKIPNFKKPVALAQDYRLNLYACGEFDTTISGVNKTFGAVYKIDLVSAGHIIENAKAMRLIPISAQQFQKENRRFTGVTVFYDNSYLITRVGPDNSSPIDPDNAILQYTQV